jgi:hypothetical protein
VLHYSQKLGNDTEMSLLQILEPWELLVEVLCKIEHLLRGVEDVILGHLAYVDELGHYIDVDQLFLSQLLTDL